MTTKRTEFEYAFSKQLEFPFMIDMVPWDGQYTFLHYITREGAQAANREVGTNINESLPLTIMPSVV